MNTIPPPSASSACSAGKPLRFTESDVDSANAEWGFNCGPAALCACLNLTPNEILPNLPAFNFRRFMSPTDIRAFLFRLKIIHKLIYRNDDPGYYTPVLANGLLRVQFAGRWTNPHVPIRARYQHTHWVAARNNSTEIFDINAMDQGGWIPKPKWELELLPLIIRECCPKATGQWWFTHAIEISS